MGESYRSTCSDLYVNCCNNKNQRLNSSMQQQKMQKDLIDQTCHCKCGKCSTNNNANAQKFKQSIMKKCKKHHRPNPSCKRCQYSFEESNYFNQKNEEDFNKSLISRSASMSMVSMVADQTKELARVNSGMDLKAVSENKHICEQCVRKC